MKKEVETLEQTKEQYVTKIAEDSVRLQELKTNRENLEKFAREQYFMKKPNEDLFIIVDENNEGIEDQSN